MIIRSISSHARLRVHLENASRDDAVLQHVVVVVGPSPETAQGRRELEDEWGHGLALKPDQQRKDDCSRQNASQDKLNERKVD